METIKQARLIQNATSIPNYGKLNKHIIKPLKGGFWGFATILMIILFLNLISFVIGSNEKFGMDSLDLQLAGVGFILQVTRSSLENFIN